MANSTNIHLVDSKMVATTKSSYEKLRQQRLDENKKRMEELNLTRLSQTLKTSSPMKKTAKPRIISTETVVVRRSNRLANNPAPVYHDERLRINNFPRRVIASAEARARATLKAEALEVNLGSDHPTLVRPMLQCFVTGGWLALQRYFCRKNLPRSDETITLVDEDGEKYPIVYVAHNERLSGGWTRFNNDHQLVDGDALVFQLIKPTLLKVYIIRVNEPKEEKPRKF